jgi:hypothetical protein
MENGVAFQMVHRKMTLRTAVSSDYETVFMVESHGFEVVSRIELGAKAAPRRLLDGAIDLTQAFRWNARCHDLSDIHRYLQSHDLYAGRRKSLVEIVLS